MKIFVSSNSIYFYGKVKDLKEELIKYNLQHSIKELIKEKLN